MPTKREMEELVKECTWKRTTQRGVKGFRVTGPNGNSIFLPSARWSYDPSPYFWYIYENYDVILPIYYWTSTPRKKDLQYAYTLSYNSVDDWFRSGNAFVRPVLDFPAVEEVLVVEETEEVAVEVAVEAAATEEAAQ